MTTLAKETSSPSRALKRLASAALITTAVGTGLTTGGCAVTPDGTVYTLPVETRCYNCWAPWYYPYGYGYGYGIYPSATIHIDAWSRNDRHRRHNPHPRNDGNRDPAPRPR